MTKQLTVRALIAKWREEYPRRTSKMFNEMLDELEPLIDDIRKQSDRWKEMYELASADRAKLETSITLEALRREDNERTDKLRRHRS